MNEDGEWRSDDSHLAQCLEGKYDILKYCKRVGLSIFGENSRIWRRSVCSSGLKFHLVQNEIVIFPTTMEDSSHCFFQWHRSLKRGSRIFVGEVNHNWESDRFHIRDHLYQKCEDFVSHLHWNLKNISFHIYTKNQKYWEVMTIMSWPRRGLGTN